MTKGERMRANSKRWISKTSVRGHVARVIRARQIHGESTPFARRARHVDGATGLLDDAVHGCEPKPGAEAVWLRRYEWLEDVRKHRRIDARARVLHAERDVAAGL